MRRKHYILSRVVKWIVTSRTFKFIKKLSEKIPKELKKTIIRIFDIGTSYTCMDEKNGTWSLKFG